MSRKLLTDKNARKSNSSDQTDNDDDIEGNYKFKERKLKEPFSPFPTVMCNLDQKVLERTACKVLQHIGVDITEERIDCHLVNNLAI